MIEMTVESARLQRLNAFNRVGLKTQEALSVNDILCLMGEGLREIGFNGLVLFLDAEQKNLKIEYAFLAPSLVAKAEKLLGIKAVGFKLPVESGAAFRVAVRENRAVFTPRLGDGLKELFPSLLSPLASRAVGMLGLVKGRGIAAPLVARDKILGVLVVWSPDILEEDIPTVVAFANQAAIAIDNARLISEVEVKAKVLQDSENKFKQLLEDIKDGYAVIQDGNIVFANKRCSEIFGYEPRQLIGHNVIEFIAPEELQEIMKFYTKVINGEEEAPERLELMGIKRDGTIFPIQFGATPMQYDGKPAISIILRDITERKQVEDKYRQLLENMRDGYLVIQEGKIIFANRRFCDIFGYKPGRVPGMSFTQFIMPDDHQRAMEQYKRIISGQEAPVERKERIALKGDGTAIMVESSIKAIQYEGKPAFCATVRDITERKQMEDDLKKSDRQYRELFESAPDMVINLDASGRLILVNQSALQRLGYAKDDVLGRGFWEFLELQSIPRAMEVFERAKTGEAVTGVELSVKKKSGETILFEMSSVPNVIEGEFLGGMAILRDVMERRRMEEELRDSEQYHRVLIEMTSKLGEGIVLARDIEGMRGVIVFVNDAMTNILGYSREELLQMKMRDLVGSAAAQEVAGRYLHRQAGDKTEEHYESLALAKNGIEVPVQVETGNTIYQGQPAIVAFIRDITHRKLMEAQLMEYSKSLEQMVENRTRELRIAEESYQAIFEYAGDAIIVIDNNDMVQLWNNEAERMFGYKSEEVVGKKRHMIVPEELQGEIAWLSEETKQNGFVKNYVTERIRKNGKRLTVEITSAVLRDTQGNPIGLSTILRDITMRKLMKEQQRRLEGEKEKTQKALAFSEERYRSVFNHAGLAMGVYDKNDVVQLLNKEAERMFGYKAEELMGEKAPMVIPEDLLEDAKRLMREVKEKGYVDGYETERLRKDGTRFPVELTFASLKNEEGNTIGLNFIAKDITERKRLEREKEEAQAALARSEERYRSIVEHSGLAMGIFEKNGLVQLLNKDAEMMFGYKAEEVSGEKAFIASIPEDLLEETRWLMSEAKEKGYVDGFETERLRKDGTRFPVEVSIASLKDEEGNYIGGSFIVKDITERKRLEREKEEAQQRLTIAERLAAIGELASIVGHELRNPLAVIGNSVYFLRMKLGDSDEKVRKHLGILEDEVVISGRIISNILDFARPKQPIFQDTNINAVIERALEKYPLPDNVKVVTEMGKDLSQITADTDQLQQIFINLISNAVQAMPEGGKLIIRTTQNDNLARVEFEDTGIGISPENLEKIFQPMFSTKAKGIGLGLTITKRIVESHHGKLEVSSQVGKGTTFIITLPIGGKDER